MLLNIHIERDQIVGTNFVKKKRMNEYTLGLGQDEMDLTI